MFYITLEITFFPHVKSWQNGALFHFKYEFDKRWIVEGSENICVAAAGNTRRPGKVHQLNQ